MTFGTFRAMSSRVLPTFGDLFRLVLLIAFLAVLAIGTANVPGVVGDKVGDVLSSLNPFSAKTVDRTGPSVLKSLTDLSEYHAASAHYETVVDIQEDNGFLPDVLSGERVLYVGKGDVDAVVDFGDLDERRVDLSKNGTSVTIRLPAPTVDKPVLDLENSYVASHDEGIINKFRGSDLERDGPTQGGGADDHRVDWRGDADRPGRGEHEPQCCVVCSERSATPTSRSPSTSSRRRCALGTWPPLCDQRISTRVVRAPRRTPDSTPSL